MADEVESHGATSSPANSNPDQPNGETGQDEGSVTRHQCFLCSRTYERADHLSRHLKSHENERSYRCTECGKGFNRADLLNRHRAAHAKSASEVLRKRTGRACAACIKAKTKCDEVSTLERELHRPKSDSRVGWLLLLRSFPRDLCQILGPTV
jgi:DNA-directed RNA polymerase subunit RPC12/RpoP